MDHLTNDLGQPIGLPVDRAFPRPRPTHEPLTGRFCTLTATREDHAQALLAAFAEDTSGAGWTYLPNAPWHGIDDAQAFCRMAQGSADPMFYTITDDHGVISGFCSLLRIAPEVGSIEVGFIHFAPRLQKTPAATEALFLLIDHAMTDLGYRRFEWKCDALNAPSRAAAERLGFTYEGTFRQATLYKGRNRDTAWFSILDGEWDTLKARFQRWLSPGNFLETGHQKRRLKDC
ncbi:GNAT family N-acetyltransferase [Tropicibacter oceani]|uniref:GNAT family protein n=1 Tax=Tropicibacter oceani TaxID=3058420 RepID=A0ABY8QHD4_9RHOB|nr:GNAT family protein [Tropicibacter oceani]WGW03940.1 GNAT family protein [Tropicibacter oceani]